MTARPTRHRLVVATGVATGFLALLLVLLDFFLPVEPGLRNAREMGDQVLRVLIRRREIPAPADPELKNPRTSLSERADEPAVEAVANLRNEKRAINSTSEFMWRQSHSVMFAPENEFVPRAVEPVLADLRFRPEINVAGVGLKIGPCFIGLPLIGVPVEQRTVAIRLFVCADGSG